MKKIGEGKTAVVFTDGLFAYKKYHTHYDIRNIEYEVRVQNEIYDKTDLLVCHYEIDNQMIKMTLIEGVELADRIRIEKYKNWLEDFTDLQCKTYLYEKLDLLDAYEVFHKQILSSKLTQSLKTKALESLGKIKKTYHLCHLDFHPLNIIYSNNDYYIIDWTNAKLANPVMDIASTYIIFRQYLKRQANRYLKMMIKKTGYSKEEIINAIPLMAFIKLRENEELEQEEVLKELITGIDIV
jgi:tRNA A-37 threonylcarbamoyl transferase component Bud32